MSLTPTRAPQPGIWSWCGIAIGGAACLHALPDLLHHGGMAALTVSGFVALGVATPTALVLWQDEGIDLPAKRSVFAHTTILTTTAVTLATAALSVGHPAAQLLAVMCWLALPIVARTRIHPAAAAVLVFAAALAVVAPFGSSIPVATTAPWSLLTPRWGGWSDWWAPALRTGLLMGLVAPTWWHGTRRRPGSGRHPWRVPGVLLLFAAWTSLVLGFRYETLPAVIADGTPWAAAPLALLMLVALPKLNDTTLDVRVDMAAGALLTLAFSGPGAAAIPWWWSTVLPLAIAWTLGQHMVDRRQPLLAPAVALLMLAAVAGFSGTPAEFAPAVLAAMVVVAWLWLATLRGTLVEAR